MNIPIFFLILISSSQARKISGDAAPEKAQEFIEPRAPKVVDLDSSFRIPSPLPIEIGPPSTYPSTTVSPSAGLAASSPAQPPSVLIEPPASQPVEEVISSTLTPPPITTSGFTDGSTTTVFSTVPPSTTAEVIVEDDLDNEISNIQKADIEKEEPSNDVEVKELIEKIEVNRTADFYITSSTIPSTTTTTTTTTTSFNETIEGEGKQENEEDDEDDGDMMNFNELFDKKQRTSSTTTTSNSTFESFETSTTEIVTSTSEPLSTTSVLLTTTMMAEKKPHKHSKTCIHIEQLKNVDNNTKHARKGTIEVSVELKDGEKLDSAQKSSTEESEEDNKVGDSQEEEEQGVAEVVERKTRESQGPPKWKKYEMDCSVEEDEKGDICKLWATSGLCMTNKPTMFLFCRKTCLCVGPS